MLAIISDALIFFLKYIVQSQVIGYAHLWLALPKAPHPGSVCPTRHFRAAGRWAGQAKESFC